MTNPIPIFIFSVGCLWMAGIRQPSQAATLYVNQSNSNPAAPYVTWATASQTIQDAVDSAQPGDEILVTNGIYATGGRVFHGALTNRVVIDKTITVRSFQGPQSTIIRGGLASGTTNGNDAIRCVYLRGATLSGFMITGGATLAWSTDDDDRSGGGVFGSGVVSNCVITGNSASHRGGGVFGCFVDNSEVIENTACAPVLGMMTAMVEVRVACL